MYGSVGGRGLFRRCLLIDDDDIAPFLHGGGGSAGIMGVVTVGGVGLDVWIVGCFCFKGREGTVVGGGMGFGLAVVTNGAVVAVAGKEEEEREERALK